MLGKEYLLVNAGVKPKSTKREYRNILASIYNLVIKYNKTGRLYKAERVTEIYKSAPDIKYPNIFILIDLLSHLSKKSYILTKYTDRF